MDYNAILEPRRLLQIIALISSTAALWVVIYRAYIARTRCTKRILIAPIVFLLHMAIYYATVLVSQEAVDLDHVIIGHDITFHAWSAGISIHAIVTVVFLAYAYLHQHRLREELEQWNILHKSQLF